MELKKHLLDQALVDPHLIRIPGLAALTTRGLAGCDLQVLGRQADGAFDTQVLGLGTLDQLAGDLFQARDIAGGEGDLFLVVASAQSFSRSSDFK